MMLTGAERRQLQKQKEEEMLISLVIIWILIRLEAPAWCYVVTIIDMILMTADIMAKEK